MPSGTKPSLAVVIPSRLQKISEDATDSDYFVERAMRSVLAQTQLASQEIEVNFVLGVDDDALIPERIASCQNTFVCRSTGRSQAAALNACIEFVAPHYRMVAFLEDDDRWESDYLTWALKALNSYDFVSSTQLEVDDTDTIIRVNDFPTPSGWIMPVATLTKIGLFDCAFRWHIDNDWLGRLARSGLSRCHLVEVTAPTTLASSLQVRPWIANVLRLAGPFSDVKRHASTAPLVVRLVHPRSGMAMIASNPVLAAESRKEQEMLLGRFGHIPW